MKIRRGAGLRPAHLIFPILFAAAFAQQSPTIDVGTITKGDRPAIAIPDLRGAGEAQALMPAFNQTLWGDITGAGIFKMIPKTSYPTTVPQQPSDFTQPVAPAEPP